MKWELLFGKAAVVGWRSTFFTIQCGNLKFTLRCQTQDATRVNRAVATLGRGGFDAWDQLTPQQRAQHEADVEWLLAQADQAKLQHHGL